MRSAWTFYAPGQLVYGRGCVAQLGRLAVRRRWRRVVIVSDPHLHAAGLVEQVSSALAAGGVESHAVLAGEPEPAVEAAERAAEQAGRFAPDAVLGLGGGSNMDLAKFVAILLRHGGQPRDYFGFDRVPGPVLPLVCVPTTAGTGSEVSHAAVLTDRCQAIKVSTLSQFLRPALAVVDPALTDGCPSKVTADSGVDALVHAIEAFTARDWQEVGGEGDGPRAYEGRTPLGECLAERAIRLIAQHLPAAAQRPGDRVARDAMALAATLAGLAFSHSGVALVHALEYPLGGAVHISHGAGNGLLLPHVLRYNLPVRQREIAQLASFLGEACDGEAPYQAAERAIAAVQRLTAAVGIPQRLRDLGVTRDQLPEFAAKAFAIKRLMDTNPRVPTQADLLAIYEQAF
jgi:alcohol dehydrogenase class IV